MRHGIGTGGGDYLPKPFTIDALYAACGNAAQEGATVRDEGGKKEKLTTCGTNISMLLPHETATPLNGILAYGEEILTTDAATLQPAESRRWGRFHT